MASRVVKKKYEIRDDGRIVALRKGRWGEAGTVGGFVDGEHNLSHTGKSWVAWNAQVRDYASVSGNARIGQEAQILDNAKISGNAAVVGNAVVGDYAEISGKALIMDNARVGDNAKVTGDYTSIVGNTIIRGNTVVDKPLLEGEYNSTEDIYDRKKEDMYDTGVSSGLWSERDIDIIHRQEDDLITHLQQAVAKERPIPTHNEVWRYTKQAGIAEDYERDELLLGFMDFIYGGSKDEGELLKRWKGYHAKKTSAVPHSPIIPMPESSKNEKSRPMPASMKKVLGSKPKPATRRRR